MALPAVVWGGIWVAGMIGARLAARQVIRHIMRAAARRLASQAAQQALRTAITAGTLAPTDYTGIDRTYSSADDKANALARAMAATCAADPRKCRACDATRGRPVARNWNMSARARAYQKFISGFPTSVEYQYNGVDFDGFWMPVCTLVEAKDNYTQFLDVSVSEGGIFSSRGISSVDWHSWYGGVEALASEGQRQHRAARPSPPVLLQWHCSQIAATIAIAALFNERGIPIVPQYTPHPGAPDPYSGYIE
jgi:hypothetical protein